MYQVHLVCLITLFPNAGCLHAHRIGQLPTRTRSCTTSWGRLLESLGGRQMLRVCLEEGHTCTVALAKRCQLRGQATRCYCWRKNDWTVPVPLSCSYSMHIATQCT